MQSEKPIINFNGEIKIYGGTVTGNINHAVNNFGKNMDASSTREKVCNALQKIDEEGLLTDKTQWYAIFRFLTDKYMAPRKPEDFENYIKGLELNIGVMCEKDKYKNVASSCPRLKADVEAWPSLLAPSTAESNQIIIP